MTIAYAEDSLYDLSFRSLVGAMLFRNKSSDEGFVQRVNLAENFRLQCGGLRHGRLGSLEAAGRWRRCLKDGGVHSLRSSYLVEHRNSVFVFIWAQTLPNTIAPPSGKVNRRFHASRDNGQVVSGGRQDGSGYSCWSPTGCGRRAAGAGARWPRRVF